MVQIPYSEATAVENMARDVAMLRQGGREGCALWRTYGWTESAVTFGYSQKWADIQASLPGFSGKCIRRMTGGGIVDHRNDLTYALSIPASHKLYRVHASIVYKGIHARIRDILREQGHDSGLSSCAPHCAKPLSGGVSICFQAAEPFDVIDQASGRKQAGAAMKRDRSGLLIQGSLDRAALPDLDRALFERAFSGALACWLDLPPASVASDLQEALLIPERERFAAAQWNQRR